jgi:hypothetical protein
MSEKLNLFSTSPADRFVAVTPSDTVNLTKTARALYIGGYGDVVAVNQSGVAVTFVGLLAGSILPVVCIRVNATNTTATNIVALL